MATGDTDRVATVYTQRVATGDTQRVATGEPAHGVAGDAQHVATGELSRLVAGENRLGLPMVLLVWFIAFTTGMIPTKS